MAKKILEAALEAEVAAHREAIEAYASQMQKLLGEDAYFDALANTSHLHRSVAVARDGRAVIVTVQVDFSPPLEASQIQEMLRQAKRSPGSVPSL